MSTCADWRRAALTDPRAIDPALRAHAQTCPDCEAFTRRAAAFEERLARALAVEFPPAAASGARVVALHAGRTRAGRVGSVGTAFGGRRWLAIAASLTLAIGVAGTLWLAVPRPSLAGEVVAHMAGEPQAWRVTDAAVPPGALQPVLRDARLHLTGAAGVVSYANSCRFRGHLVPHLVVLTDQGPVTVMVLVHESSGQRVTFDESGYRGVIVPVPGHGSIAVLAKEGAGEPADAAAVERIATRVQGALVWD